jgi:hypothetical protein
MESCLNQKMNKVKLSEGKPRNANENLQKARAARKEVNQEKKDNVNKVKESVSH